MIDLVSEYMESFTNTISLRTTYFMQTASLSIVVIGILHCGVVAHLSCGVIGSVSVIDVHLVWRVCT